MLCHIFCKDFFYGNNHHRIINISVDATVTKIDRAILRITGASDTGVRDGVGYKPVRLRL